MDDLGVPPFQETSIFASNRFLNQSLSIGRPVGLDLPATDATYWRKLIGLAHPQTIVNTNSPSGKLTKHITMENHHVQWVNSV